MKIKCKKAHSYYKNDGTSPMRFSAGVHDVADNVGKYLIEHDYAEKVKVKKGDDSADAHSSDKLNDLTNELNSLKPAK